MRAHSVRTSCYGGEPSKPEGSNSNETSQESKLIADLKRIKPVLEKALAAHPDKRAELVGAVSKIQAGIKNKNYAEAQAVVERLLGTGSGIPKGLVAKRQFMVTRWQQLPIEIKPEVDELKREVAEALPEVDSETLGQAIDEYLREFFAQIQEELDESINAGDATLLRGLKERILQNELVAELVDNPVTGGDKIRAIVERVLDEVESALAS